MSAKRSSSSSPRAPRKRSTVASGRPRILSAAEKRELILAHAAMRKTRDPVQLASLWAGVATTFLVVLVAWAWAFIPGVMKAFRDPVDQEVAQIVAGAQDAGREAERVADTSDLANEIARTTAQLSSLSNQAESQQAALNRLADALNATSTAVTSSARTDVFHSTTTSP